MAYTRLRRQNIHVFESQRFVAIAVLTLAMGGCAHTKSDETGELPTATSDESEYFDIGDFRCPVSTQSPEAQLWFDRGLAMCHAFNHEESIRCFEKAVAADPGMPMAYWGLAHAWGPNINNIQIDSNQLSQAKFALRLAQLHEPHATTREADIFDAFIPTRLHVLIRFGCWEDILNELQPADFLPMTRSVWHYARGIAYAATSRVSEAESEQAKFLEARQAVPTTSTLFNNESRRLLDVAQAMLRGEIDYRRGDYVEAFAAFREAVRLDDALNYDEPWGWMQPTRHALGGLLIEQGHHREAEQVFRTDLKRHPHNPWALQGLAESLEKQGSLDDATIVRKQLKTAALRSDVEIDRSCFCRLECESCRH